MKILGYSERGLLNALFYEIAASKDADQRFQELITIASFPYTDQRPPAGSVDLMIEQSLSDFGDADAIALITDSDNHICSLFIEAKVKTFQRSDWLIDDEFKQFITGLQSKVSSSNLFTQLYHKSRLVYALQEGGIDALSEGIQFPSWSKKRQRKIGNNGIVLKAIARLKEHVRNPFFLAIVPDTPERVAAFFKSSLTIRELENVSHLDFSRFGYLTWQQVQQFCIQIGMPQTLAVFEFNQGQIYLE